MLSVFICEDSPPHQREIRKYVESYISANNFDMKVILSTPDPYEIIDYLGENKINGLYFLDIQLNQDIDGIDLGKKIRELDPRGFIVFISVYSEMMPLTVSNRVEAMDFISKENVWDIREKVEECIAEAYKRYTSNAQILPMFRFTVFGYEYALEYSEVVFLETVSASKNKVRIHAISGIYEYRGTLGELEDLPNDDFFRCHESYIVNLNQVDGLDKAKKNILLKSGAACPVSRRAFPGLAERLGIQQVPPAAPQPPESPLHKIFKFKK